MDYIQINRCQMVEIDIRDILSSSWDSVGIVSSRFDVFFSLQNLPSINLESRRSSFALKKSPKKIRLTLINIIVIHRWITIPAHFSLHNRSPKPINDDVMYNTRFKISVLYKRKYRKWWELKRALIFEKREARTNRQC